MNKTAHFVFIMAALISESAVGQVCVKQLNVPKYPPVAWAAQLAGAVDLTIKIGTQGNVVSVKGSGPSPVLVEGSKENIRDWVFCTPEHGGSAHVRLRYDYRLVGARVYRPPTAKVVLDLGEGTVAITLPPAEPQP